MRAGEAMVVCQGIVASTACTLRNAWEAPAPGGLLQGELKGCPGPLTMVQVR